jgi:molybdopterin-guanine dinucleotide biosynthesis protein A
MGEVTTAILAGGAATRLGGADKGLQLLGGRPLIEWVIDGLSGTPREALLIVANRSADRYAKYARTISDAQPGYRGPLAGIASALSACTTVWLLTLPVDCPCPPSDLLSRLRKAASVDDADAIVVHDGERRQPLFALYRRELADSAAQAVVSGQGVWKWQESIGARELDLSDRRAQLINLNTPGDFAAFAECLHGPD